MQTSYSSCQYVWQSDIGIAVRCLLNLENEAGAFLWFYDTVRDAGIVSFADVKAGQIVRLMLLHKLRDYDESYTLPAKAF